MSYVTAVGIINGRKQTFVFTPTGEMRILRDTYEPVPDDKTLSKKLIAPMHISVSDVRSSDVYRVFYTSDIPGNQITLLFFREAAARHESKRRGLK